MKTCGPVLALMVALTAACSAGDHRLDEAERNTIARAVDSATLAFEAAERARDAEAIIAHLAADFYMYNDGRRTPYDSVVASIRRSMRTFQHFEPGFRDIEVRVLGRHAALVSLTFHDSIVTNTGDTMRFSGPTTLIWQRRGADWRIIYADADHYAVQ